MIETKYKIKAVNSDRDYCECCGKENISKVVWIENTETGEINHYGTVCAQSPEKGVGKKAVKKAISYAENKESYCRVNSWENDKVNEEKYQYYWDTYPTQEQMA